MTSTPDPLAAALESLAGRADGATSRVAAVAYARRLRAAVARLDAAPRCPPSVLRRLEEAFRQRPAPAGRRLLALLFDSWASAAPAMRGAGSVRLLRYSDGTDSVDVEVERAASGMTLRVAVSPAAGRRADVRLAGAARTRPLRLDADGVGRARVRPKEGPAVVVVREGRREAFRTPPLPLE